jgi:hypothetical protein
MSYFLRISQEAIVTSKEPEVRALFWLHFQYFILFLKILFNSYIHFTFSSQESCFFLCFSSSFQSSSSSVFVLSWSFLYIKGSWVVLWLALWFIFLSISRPDPKLLYVCFLRKPLWGTCFLPEMDLSQYCFLLDTGCERNPVWVRGASGRSRPVKTWHTIPRG